MQTRRNWSINRCSTGETFFDSFIQICSTITEIWTKMIHLRFEKKEWKGMLRSDICEKEDNHKFFKNSSETRTFVSVTFSKLPF